MTVSINTNLPPAVEQDEGKRTAVTGVLTKLGELGWTRPAIREALAQLGNPLTDSAVYRAQRDRVHTREVPIWAEFFKAVDDGVVKAPEKAGKIDVKAVVQRAAQAAKVLADLGDKPTAKLMHETIAKVMELLPAPAVDESVAEPAPEPKNDAGGEQGNEPEANGGQAEVA